MFQCVKSNHNTHTLLLLMPFGTQGDKQVTYGSDVIKSGASTKG